jgi:hypothetical protein
MQTRLLRLNSKYREAGESGNNFTINIPSSSLENVLRCSLQSASVPRMFSNIFNGINAFRFYRIQPSGTEFYEYFIEPGQFTATELALYITTTIANSLIVTYDDVAQRFVFTNTSAATEYYIDTYSSDSILTYMGLASNFFTPLLFFDPSYFIPIASTHNAQSPPNLSGPNTVYIESNVIANNSCFDVYSNGVMLPLVTPINCSAVPYGFTISYVAPTDSMWLLAYDSDSTGVSLRSINVRLTDQFGNLLNIPDNSYCDLVFKLYYASTK